MRWRTELVRDLGGEQQISAQQRALVDLASRSKLYLDSVDAYLMTQPSLVNARRRSVIPVLRERQALADSLARVLQALGLERRRGKAKEILELERLLDGDPDLVAG